LYFQKGTSNKFWRIAQDGRKTWTFYGRIEAGEDNERMLEKLHKSTASAKAYALSKYREKVRGGYTAVYDSVKAGRVDLFYGTKRGARSGLSSAVWAAAGKKKSASPKPPARKATAGTRPLRVVEKRRGCPSCGRRKGAKCRTPSGAVAKKPHKGRR